MLEPAVSSVQNNPPQPTFSPTSISHIYLRLDLPCRTIPRNNLETLPNIPCANRDQLTKVACSKAAASTRQCWLHMSTIRDQEVVLTKLQILIQLGPRRLASTMASHRRQGLSQSLVHWCQKRPILRQVCVFRRSRRQNIWAPCPEHPERSDEENHLDDTTKLSPATSFIST